MPAGAFSTQLLGPHHSQHPRTLFEQPPDGPEAALGLRGPSSYDPWDSARQAGTRTPPSEARPGAPAPGLAALLSLETTEPRLGVVHERHGLGDGPVARLLADEPVHFLDNPAVGRMTLGPGAQLQDVHRL